MEYLYVVSFHELFMAVSSRLFMILNIVQFAESLIRLMSSALLFLLISHPSEREEKVE